MLWGLLDTVDRVWMGNDAGPLTYEEEWLARTAAQVVDVRCGYPPGRTRAVEYIEGPKRLRDSVDTKMTTLDAIKGIEEGRLM